MLIHLFCQLTMKGRSVCLSKVLNVSMKLLLNFKKLARLIWMLILYFLCFMMLLKIIWLGKSVVDKPPSSYEDIANTSLVFGYVLLEPYLEKTNLQYNSEYYSYFTLVKYVWICWQIWREKHHACWWSSRSWHFGRVTRWIVKYIPSRVLETSYQALFTAR